MTPEPGQSAAVAHRLIPDLVPTADAIERPIIVDQTNISIVVAEAVVVKWLESPVTAPHPGVQMLEHLSAVGFAEMPSFHGCEVVDGEVVALVTGLIAGAVDGWEWYVDVCTAELDGSGPAESVAIAERLGAMAARLHDAMAHASDVFPTPVAPVSLRDEWERGCDLLVTARRLVRGELKDRLAARAARIRATVDELADRRSVPGQRIHGDLHVGQVLRSGTMIVVTDFDGDPLADAPAGHRLRSPMADLASLVQSVDHVGRVVGYRNRALVEPADALVAEANDALVASYGRTCPVDDAVLGPLRTIQELHEHVYAATMLPRWGYVPDRALAAMYP
ncbi:hypothetical protein BH24ACT5_BH24ACT5_16590 [soil metagenome]